MKEQFRKIFTVLITMFMFVNIFTVSLKADEEETSLQEEETVETVSGDAVREDGQEEETQVTEEDPGTGEEETVTDESKQDGEETAPAVEDQGENETAPEEDPGEQIEGISEEEVPAQEEEGSLEGLTPPEKEDDILPGDGSDEGEIITVDLSEYIIQEGGFKEYELQIDGIESITAEDLMAVTYSPAEMAILNALKARKSKIGMSGYGLNDKGIQDAFFKVINENPDLFYVRSAVGWDHPGGIVTNVYFYYYSYTQKQIDTFNQTVEAIVNKADPSWSPLAKAIFFHDWIERCCTYDYSFSRFNAYNVLIDGTAVCQGYALAYACLCKKAGLQCQIITSDKINHAWNVIKLNGEYFYVDCTWDDPSNVVPDCFYYDNFLCSRDQFKNEQNHNSTDWKLNNVSNAYNGIKTAATYDGVFWKTISNLRPLAVSGDLTLYADLDARKLVVYDLSSLQIYKTIDLPGNIYDYYDGFSAVAIDGRFYFANAYDIYSLDLAAGTTEKIYTLSDSEKEYGSIYVLGAKNHKVQYKLTDQYYDRTDYLLKGTLGAESTVVQNASTGELIIASDDEGMFIYLDSYDSSLKIITDPDSADEQVFTLTPSGYSVRPFKDYYYEVVKPIIDDEYASIPLNVLKTHNVPSTSAVVEIEYFGKTFRSPVFYLQACENAPEVNVSQGSDGLIITGDDAYLRSLTEPDVTDRKNSTSQKGSSIKIVSDGRSGTIANQRVITSKYDTTSAEIIYDDGVVRVPREALLNNNIMNGLDVTVTFYVCGFAGKKVTLDGGLDLACVPGTVDFTVSQQVNGDIFIESENKEWLQALALPYVYVGAEKQPSFNDCGSIFGTYHDFKIGTRSVPLEIELLNEQYDDTAKTEYYFADGRLIIPAKTLTDANVPDGTYDLSLHAPGYEDNKISDVVIASDVRAYAPSDLVFYSDKKYGIMAKTSDRDWLNALTQGSIVVVDAEDEETAFDTANCFQWLSGDDVVYLSAGYLLGAGIKSGRYRVLFRPKNLVSYGVNYKLDIPSTTKKIFTVKFFDDDGNMTGAVSVKQGNKVKAPASPVKQGYTFAGWFHEGKKFDTAKAVAKNMELHPGWKENTYKLVYNVNGGKGTLPKATTYKLNDQVNITDAVPEKGGYAFLGWTSVKGSNDVEYVAGDDITRINYEMKNGVTITMYAVWSDPLTYSLELDPRYGTLKAKQSYDPRFVQSGSQYTAQYNVLSSAFKLPVLVKDHYKFNGWYEDVWNASKGKMIPTKRTSIAKGSYGDKYVYASFTPVAYKLTYKLNKGKLIKGQIYDKSFTIETMDITLPEPIRKGYVFKGWYADKELTKAVDSVDDLRLKDTALYAKWEPITYSVVFRCGTDETAPVTLTYDETINLNRPIFDSAEYGFLPTRYSYVNDAGKTVSLKSMKVKNLTATQGKTIVIDCSDFKKATYKVTYVLDGGKNVKANKTSYTVDTPFILADATKKGYTFGGWYEDEGCTGARVSELTIGDHTLYAKFTINTYTINYKLNGGVNDALNPSWYTVATPKIVLKAPVKEGSTFVGWYNTATGRKVTAIAKGSIGNIELEARWK